MKARNCPECGKRKPKFSVIKGLSGKIIRCNAYCPNCKLNFNKWFDKRKEAIEYWNSWTFKK